jgi:hypothetical protein
MSLLLWPNPHTALLWPNPRTAARTHISGAEFIEILSLTSLSSQSLRFPLQLRDLGIQPLKLRQLLSYQSLKALALLSNTRFTQFAIF